MKIDKKFAWKSFWVPVITFGFALGSSLALASPPPWAPAHGYRAKKHHHKVYTYTYYPAAQVYYNPVVQKYYYMNDGAWTYGVALPPSIQLGKGVSVSLGGPVPYVYHPTVVKQYPVVVVPSY